MMSTPITDDQQVKLGKVLIMKGLNREDCLDIMTALDTAERLDLFYTKLLENIEMTPEEVYQAAGEAMMEA